MSHFRFSFKTIDLRLDQPFTISRGTKATVSNVFFELTDGSHTGYGEAGPNTRYNEDAAKVTAFMESLPDDFFEDLDTADQLAKKLDEHIKSGNKPIKSAEAAIETAWLDWWGKSQEQAVWRLWDAPSPIGPITSYTIGLDEVDVMQQKVEAADEYPIYKVKLGTDRDCAIIKALREVTDKPIRVDANEGWTTLDQAKQMIRFLAEQHIELIEQPMPAGQVEDLRSLKDFSPLPLCADESFTGRESLEETAKAFDIINIKLMKIGSLAKAKKVIDQAGTYGLEVMIGCMIESSIGNTAGALLSLWADYADLDGHLLIRNDPAEGLTLNDDKQIVMPDRPGLGLMMK